MTTNNNNSLNFTGISMLDMPSILTNIDWDPGLAWPSYVDMLSSTRVRVPPQEENSTVPETTAPVSSALTPPPTSPLPTTTSASWSPATPPPTSPVPASLSPVITPPPVWPITPLPLPTLIPIAKTVFSPMELMNCPRGPGRPKKKRFGAPSVLKAPEDFDKNEAPPKKSRGRPPGAKKLLLDLDLSRNKRIVMIVIKLTTLWIGLGSLQMLLKQLQLSTLNSTTLI